MKAISGRYGIPEATVAAIAAGCDAVLMCGGDQEPQVAALEAVIHAVEEGTLPLTRVEDALARHRRVKERFLAPRRPRPLSRRPLRAPSAATSTRQSPPRWRGSLSLADAQTARSAARRPHRRRRARQPVRARRVRSRRRRAAALGFEPVTTTASSSGQGMSPARPSPRRARSPAPGRPIPIAASIAARGGYGSVQMLPLLDAAAVGQTPRPSSATATTRRS